MQMPLNPLVPGPLAVVIMVVAVALAVLYVAALVSLWRNSTVLGGQATLVWGAVIIIFPALGSIVWFAVGRPRVAALKSTLRG